MRQPSRQRIFPTPHPPDGTAFKKNSHFRSDAGMVRSLRTRGMIVAFMALHWHMLEQIISAFKSPVRTLFYPCSCCPRPKKPQCRTYPDCWQRRQRQCVPCLRAQSDEARRIFPRTSSFLPLPCNSHATHMQHTCNTHIRCNMSTVPENSQ